MKIKYMDEDCIEFDNTYEITYDNYQNTNDVVYVDFFGLDNEALDYDFKKNLIFEKTDGGFNFGNKNGKMFFVPCHSNQCEDVKIVVSLNNKPVLYIDDGFNDVND